jgi:hypothetical protein
MGCSVGCVVAAGHPFCGRATSGMAVRPFQGWPARRAKKDRIWQAWVSLLGVLGHPLPYALDGVCSFI